DLASALHRIPVHRHRHADPGQGLRSGNHVDRGEDHSCRPHRAGRELRHAAGSIEPHRGEETHQTMNTSRHGWAAAFAAVTRATMAAMLIAAMAAAAGCSDDSNPNSPTPRGEYSQTDVRTGTGAEATNGKRL